VGVTGDIRSFYEGALIALRFVEARRPTGRRFGPDADARWSAFRGDLKTADRLDLLIRDADAQWPGSFGARTVFARENVAEDDPFGPEHEPMDPVDAEELWRAVLARPLPATVAATLTEVAAAWKLTLTPIAAGAVEPTDQFVIAGPSAIVSAAAAFSEGRDLDWSEQVTIVATPPGHRQLGAVAAALLNASRAAALFTAGGSPPTTRARLLASPDADSADVARARAITGGV
jgi:hypothetical protein